MKKILTAIVALLMTGFLAAQVIVRTENGIYYLPVSKIDSLTISRHRVLYGDFSVADGKHVAFSPGNLQCSGVKSGNYHWKFAYQQYEYLGAANIDGTGLADKIDLFGWSGNNTSAPWGISTSTTASDYSGDFKDWGENTIGTDAANTWRTLSDEEWLYLFHGRYNAENLFALGTVNGVSGIILLPDDWANTTGITFTPSTTKGLEWNTSYNQYADFTGNKHYEDNIFTLPQWQILEQAGAVFLPAANFRQGNVYDYKTSQFWSPTLQYWSSTSNGTDAGDMAAGYMFIYIASMNKSYGYSVRLVQDVEHEFKITCEGGSVVITPSVTQSVKGKTITFTITQPKTGGYRKVKVVTAKGTEVTTTETSTGTYTFTMPASNVTISLEHYYNVTLTAPVNGTMTATTETGTTFTTTTTVVEGEWFTMTATPDAAKDAILSRVEFTGTDDAGNAVDDVWIPKSGTTTYQYTPKGDVTVTATFALPISVSATKKVYFSPGNLQCTPATMTWRFAEHQYDRRGSENSKMSTTYTGWVDLFGWSAEGATVQYGVSNSEKEADYIGTKTFKDWGNNVIGEDDANTWYTMPKAEWQYLLFTRTDADKLVGMGSMNGIKGLFICPDGWTCPSGITFKSMHDESTVTNGVYGAERYYLNTSGTNFTFNTFTLANWQVLEASGVVFLPVAGFRGENNVWQEKTTQKGTLVYYWLTDYASETPYLCISQQFLHTLDGCSIIYGNAVRLVKEVK